MENHLILEPRKIQSVIVSIVSPSICHEVMGLDVMILVFLNVEFQASFFTLIKKLFSSSLPSAIRVVSSACLRSLIYLPGILIPAYDPCARLCNCYHVIPTRTSMKLLQLTILKAIFSCPLLFELFSLSIFMKSFLSNLLLYSFPLVFLLALGHLPNILRIFHFGKGMGSGLPGRIETKFWIWNGEKK